MKKFFKLLLCFCVFIAAGFSSLSAQTTEDRNAIGIYFLGSNDVIGGLQYERRITDLISIKLDSFIYYTSLYDSKPFNYNVNAEFDFTVYEADWNRFSGSRLYVYGLAGNQGYIKTESNYNTDGKITGYSRSPIYENLILSAGFGFDFVFFKHLSIPIQFGFMGNLPNDMAAGFCGGAGIRYSW